MPHASAELVHQFASGVERFAFSEGQIVIAGERALFAARCSSSGQLQKFRRFYVER
jgi:hypothetical protein